MLLSSRWCIIFRQIDVALEMDIGDTDRPMARRILLPLLLCDSLRDDGLSLGGLESLCEKDLSVKKQNKNNEMFVPDERAFKRSASVGTFRLCHKSLNSNIFGQYRCTT